MAFTVLGWSNFFGVLAGLTALVTYALYLRQTVKGKSTPNPSTWAIWLVVGVINAFTYFSVVNNNFWQSFIMFTVTLSILVVFSYAMVRGKFTVVSRLEVIVFLFAVLIGVFWQVSDNARISNLLLQGIYVLSYIPTAVGLISGSGREHLPPWIAASVAYVFTTVSLVLNFPGDWVSFVNPVVNGIIGNGVIAAIIYTKRVR